MPRLSALLFVLALVLQACATSRGSLAAAPAQLEFDFELIDGHLDRRGDVRGRLMIHVISGVAQLLRDIDPELKVAGDFYECSSGTSVSVVFVDYVIRKNPPTVLIDEGYWFGHDYSEMLINPEATVPKCVEGLFSVLATDANDEGVVRVAKKKIRLLRRDE
jgi:hypothetical protein